MTRAIGLCACVLASAAIAFGTMARAETLAGSLKETQGKVLVNAGNGYELAQPGMLLKLGDRVLTMAGASALVIQDDGCVTRLAENVVFMLQTPSVCDGGVDSARGVGPYLAQAIGAEEAPPAPAAPATEVDAPEEQPEAVAEGEEVPEEEKKKKGWLWALAGLLVLGGGGSSSSSSAVFHP